MKRQITCKSCKEVYLLKTTAPSRHELEDKLGRYFDSKCSHCDSEQEYHVNEVKAEETGYSIIFYIIAGSLSIGLVSFAITSFGLIGAAIIIIPAFVYMRLVAQNKEAVNLFNQSEISRTRTT